VITLPGQHLLADVPLQCDAVVRHRGGDLADLADQMLGQRRQQQWPIGWHHVVVGRRDWCRQRDLKFDPSRDDAVALQSLEQLPRRDRHVGITGLERGRVWSRAGFDAQARNFTQKLAVALGEFERWHLGGDLDRRVVGEHLLQKSDPGFLRIPVSPSGKRRRYGPVVSASLRNTVSPSGSGVLPTKCAIGAWCELPPRRPPESSAARSF